MTPHDDVERGRQAAELLAHPLMAEALAAIDTEIVRQWAECGAMDKDGRDTLWHVKRAHDRFKSLLNGYIQSGKLAAENIRRMDEHKQGLKGLLQRVRG